MAYLENRQHAPDLPTDEVERALSKLAYYFDDSWLQDTHGTHVLQKLWNRRDALSTNELFTFGESLIASEKASASWLKTQIKHVREKDENNQKGAVFEILAVGFASSKQTVIPAPSNQPGYDLDIKTVEETCYRTSLKRYSQSSHEKQFMKNASRAEKTFLNGLKNSGRNALLFVESNAYPSEGDWKKLYEGIEKIGAGFSGKKEIVEINNRWLVGILPLIPDGDDEYPNGYSSHTFICASPYHKNEQQNFLSKLESAVSNLERHVNSDHNVVPIIMMLLPSSASSKTLATWAQQYIDDNTRGPLDAVIFLQPYTASKPDMSSSHIAYFMAATSSKSYHEKAKQPLELQVPVGIITGEAPEWKLNSDIGQLNLPTHYIYQQGRHYILAANESAGRFSGKISRKAPGIETVLIVNLGGNITSIGGIWGEDLCLIGG